MAITIWYFWPSYVQPCALDEYKLNSCFWKRRGRWYCLMDNGPLEITCKYIFQPLTSCFHRGCRVSVASLYEDLKATLRSYIMVGKEKIVTHFYYLWILILKWTPLNLTADYMSVLVWPCADQPCQYSCCHTHLALDWPCWGAMVGTSLTLFTVLHNIVFISCNRKCTTYLVCHPLQLYCQVKRISFHFMSIVVALSYFYEVYIFVLTIHAVKKKWQSSISLQHVKV